MGDRRREGQGSDLQVALACLAHPATLAALVVLGLNDHLWKGAGPGWLTGKLSDFAGLFFFPFLVAALLSALPGSGRTGSRGSTAFALVALWFAAAKTLAPVHAATVTLASLLVGPVTVVRDPTDLVALAALVPAWRLYRRVADHGPAPLARLVQAPALLAALLLTSATSRPEYPSVDALIEHDGAVYAVVRNKGYPTADGIHFRDSARLPRKLVDAHQSRTELSVPSNPPQRYRLRGRQVLELRDGHWQTAWRIPEGRLGFMALEKTQRWHATDIAALPGGGVIVALGTEGVVTRRADGSWTRVGVAGAEPTPTRDNLADVPGRLLDASGFLVVAATLATWVLASLLTWFSVPTPAFPVADARRSPARLATRLRSLVLGDRPRLRWPPWIRCRSWFAFDALINVLCLALIGALACRPKPPFVFLFSLPFALTVMASLAGWRRFRNESPDAQPSLRPLAVGAASAGIAAVSLLGAWHLGWIARLSTTNLLAVAVVVVAAAAAARAARPDPP